MSLTRRMVLLAAVCILPAVVLLAGSQWQLRQAREAEVRGQINEVAHAESSELETIIGGARQLLAALQRIPAIAQRNAPLCSAWLARLRQDDPTYGSIRADDLTGRAYCSSDPGRAAFDGERQEFRAVLRQGGFVVGTYQDSPLTGAPELPLLHAIGGDDGSPVGVLVLGLSLRELARQLAARLPSDALLAVLDRNGTTLLRAGPMPANGAIDPDQWIIGHGSTGRSGLQVIVARPKPAAFAALYQATWDGILLIALALLLACAAAAWVGQRFIRAPISALLATTERLRAGEFAARISLADGRSELAQLGEGLNALAAELEQRQHAQAQAEAQLRQFAATLERRVEARTQALAEANRRAAQESEHRQRSQAELAQVQKLDAIGKLTGGIAHDFNNLLAAVIGSLELALKRTEEPRLRRLLDVAMQAAQRGAGLTGQLLTVSRKQQLQLQPVAVNAVITGMRDLLARSLGTGIQLQDDLAEELWPAIADTGQLEVALLNLAINARDAMPDGGTLAFRTRNVHVSDGPLAGVTVAPGDYAMVTVADTGEGMPPEVQAKALEPFFTTKPSGKGTGLGLSMVYGFARQAGGALTIDSTPGKGTAISLYLPRAMAAPALPAPAPASPALLPSPALTVLLVDDDAMVRETTQEMLRDLGHAVTETESPFEALRLLRQDSGFDLLVADFAMPGMNGAQLATQARQLHSGLGVLIVTGYADAEALRPSWEQGWHVLRKPFAPAGLAGAINLAMQARSGAVTVRRQDEGEA